MFSEFITSQGKHFIRTFIPLQMLNRNSGRVVFVFWSVLNLSLTIGHDFFITILSNGLAYINIHFYIPKKIFRKNECCVKYPIFYKKKKLWPIKDAGSRFPVMSDSWENGKKLWIWHIPSSNLPFLGFVSFDK